MAYPTRRPGRSRGSVEPDDDDHHQYYQVGQIAWHRAACNVARQVQSDEEDSEQGSTGYDAVVFHRLEPVWQCDDSPDLLTH
jgi:hypothetical protein